MYLLTPETRIPFFERLALFTDKNEKQVVRITKVAVYSKACDEFFSGD